MKKKRIFTGLFITTVIGVLVWLGLRYRDRLKDLLKGSSDAWEEEEEIMDVIVRLDEPVM